MSSAVSDVLPPNVDEILSDIIVNNHDLLAALDYLAQPLLNNAVIDSGRTGSKAIADFRIESTNTSETVIANDHNDQGSKASSNTDGQSALTATCSSTRLDTEHDKYDVHGKIFRQPDMLKQHGTLDSVEHPFKCRECGKGFRREYAFENHKILHTNASPRRCNHCGIAFLEQCQFNKHMKVRHGECLFKCTKCNAGFYMKKDLMRHAKTHNDERPYKCDVCDYVCKRKDNLTRHKNIHANKLSFRSQESGVRSQESGIRSQESGVRSQESGVRSMVLAFIKK